MINIEDALIKEVILHRVYSLESEKESVVNDALMELRGEEEEALLLKVLLKPFTTHAHTFEFTHEVSLDYNVLFKLAQKINRGEDFIQTSAQVVQHLTDSSKHPNIKDGDLFIAAFDQVVLQGVPYRALGIYKFEDKERFIETSVHEGEVEYAIKKGIGNKKPDKACLILFTEEPYTLLIIDNNSDTDYWQNDFICQKSKNDNVNSTTNFLTITKNYITKQVNNDFEVSKADQIDLLNRSVEFFKTHETFEKEVFEKEVFQDKNVINSFRNFDESYRTEHELEIADNFEISTQAVKKQARVFKSVLKLDKNFHIYIHGDRQLIEQGVDEDGRKFYKIYYKDES